MKTAISSLFTSVLLTFGCAHNNINKKLSSTIDSLYVVDQKVQTDIIDAMNNGSGPSKIKNLVEVQSNTFLRHIPILEKIVDKNGYPTAELVGKESSGKFFFLVQHSDADVDFQESMMKYIEKEVLTGSVKGRDFAYLTDRIRLASNEPQLYGTQLEYDSKGNARPRNLYDRRNCDKRRKKYGLEPLEDYLTWATEQHREMNVKN